MNYQAPVSYDSIEGALEFLKTELQAKVDVNNKMALDSEEASTRIELLAQQEADLRQKCLELSQKLTNLEQKRESIRQELREFSQKTTDRLEKERAEFEAVRLKRREELIARESELNTRIEQLDRLELSLKEREGSLEDRHKALQEASELIAAQQDSFTTQQIAIDKAKTEQEVKVAQDTHDIDQKNTELVEKAEFIEAQVVELDKKRADFKTDNDEIDIARKQAQELVLLSQDKLHKIEVIEATLKERENRLNFRENTLKELDKTLTAKKIQLDDREATMRSH